MITKALRSHLVTKILAIILLAGVTTVGVAEIKPPAKATLINGVLEPYPAPAIGGISEWINTTPLDLNALKGKVVLIDFWTYSCINCVRTLPYLKDWYAKYHDKGLVIIGVHSPEFEFEKIGSNVKNTVEKNQIRYPVALDNQYTTWQNYQNHVWPAHYLIDKKGYVVYQHFGEGEYAVTENNIRYLLGMSQTKEVTSEKKSYNPSETPETYLGSARATHLKSPEKIALGIPTQFTYPVDLALNNWALQGSWVMSREKITSAAPQASIKIHFNSAKVYVVMGSATGKPVQVKLMLDNEALETHAGKDVKNSQIEVSQFALYSAIVFAEPMEGVLELTAESEGLEVYTFTFGDS